MNLEFLENYQWEEMYKEKAHVLALYMAMDSRTEMMQKSVGISFKALLTKFEKGMCTGYFNAKEATEISKFILN